MAITVKCEYCGIVNKRDYGACDYCGAPILSNEELASSEGRITQVGANLAIDSSGSGGIGGTVYDKTISGFYESLI